jgi:hypothetical protein
MGSILNYLITLMNQGLSAYDVEFNQLPQRYGVTQGTLSHRIKRLGLKTVKRGRKTYLTVTQLAKLDELAQFFKENPNNDINEFLRKSGESINQSFINEESVNYQNIEASSLNKTLDNNSMINNPPITKADFQLFQDEFAEFIEEHLETINKQLGDISKGVVNIKENTDYHSQLLEEGCNYTEELNDDYPEDNQLESEETISRLQGEILNLQAQVNNLIVEKENYRKYYEYWSRIMLDNPTQLDIRSLDRYTWMRVKLPFNQLISELPPR